MNGIAVPFTRASSAIHAAGNSFVSDELTACAVVNSRRLRRLREMRRRRRISAYFFVNRKLSAINSIAAPSVSRSSSATEIQYVRFMWYAG